MLKKLLKYDFRSVFKFWWIAALISTALSTLGGFCLKVIKDATFEFVTIQPPMVLLVSSWLMFILAILALSVFTVLTAIMIYVRFYQNFFTDAGYLTFTLPVKRTLHLNSKLIMGFVTQFATTFTIIVNICLMLGIAFAEEIFTKEVWDAVVKGVKVFFKELEWDSVVFIIEIILISVLVSLFNILFTYACITFASTITKRAKIITAVGIYCGANGILSFVIQMLYLFGSTTVIDFIDKQPDNMASIILILIALIVLLFVASVCALLYTFEHWMLERKLNLA